MHFHNRGRFGMLAVGSLALVGLSIPVATAAEPSPTSQVTGHGDWYAQAYEDTPDGKYTDPEQSDVTGPQRAPFGTGSHKMTIGQYAVQTELYRTNDYDGVDLGDLTRLEYSTFARNTTAGGADRQPAYLRLSVDDDNNGTLDTSLFFYPGNNGTVVNGEWQNWDVTGGKMNVDGDSGAGEISLADYAAAHPDAHLINQPYVDNQGTHDAGAVSLMAGAAETQTRGEYFVDRVIVGKSNVDTLFDLGPNAETTGSTTRKTVAPGSLQGWNHRAVDGSTNGPLSTDQEFVQGPGTPPAGAGSLKFSLSDDTNPSRVEQFRTAQYDGTLLRDVRDLSFSTFQRANAGNATPQQPVYLLLNLDDNADGTRDHTLYFFPGNNSAQAVAQGAWQRWDAAGGKWSLDGDNGPQTTISLDNYRVAHPDAKIVNTASGGGVAFTVGGGGDTQRNGEYYLDDIKIGKVDAATGQTRSADEFDLEPTPPTLSIGDTSVREGNSGATLRFPVTLSSPSSKDVTVTYKTSDGTAKAGSDYKATTGTVTIPAGSTSGVARVKVLSDKVHENDEQLNVTLGSPSYGTLADRRARGTIVDDDTRVGLHLQQASGHRVRASVDTLPAGSHSPVKVYRVLNGHTKLVLSDELNRYGRISRVLDQQYKPGTKVSFYSTVKTADGLYRSKRVSFTVR